MVVYVENERLPTELGWSKQANEVVLEQVLRISGLIANSSTLLTPTVGGAQPHKRAVTQRDLHTGMKL